jgi:undecaprenyl-diphosphatase
MRKKKGIWIGLVLFLLLVSFYLDEIIIKLVPYVQNYILNEFFMGITFVSSEILLFVILTSLFLWTERKRIWILPLWFSLVLSVLVSFVLKIWIQRPRPFQEGLISILPSLNNPNFVTWNFSFPSFQTLFVFAAVPILNKEFPRMKYFWFSLAGLVGISRIYFGLHFPSDVFAGGVIGYLIGHMIVKGEKENSFWEEFYHKYISRKMKR